MPRFAKMLYMPNEVVMSDKEIENARPIAELLDALSKAEKAADKIIERDVKSGLYDLGIGPRREAVRLLVAQGKTGTEIAKLTGVSERTIDRDIAQLKVQNGASNGASKAPYGASIPPTPQKPLLTIVPSGPLANAIGVLVEVTKGMTHEQKIDVMVTACNEVGVACSQVYQHDIELKERAGLVTHVKLY